AVFQDGNVGHRDAHFFGKLGDAHLPLRQHDVDVDDDCHAGSRYTVKSFSDFISTAFCKIRSNSAAAAATTIEGKVMRMRIKIPAGRSSGSSLNIMKITLTATKPMMAIAQYFIVRKAFTAACENISFCPAYPNTLNA